jgi:hypothetical protein
MDTAADGICELARGVQEEISSTLREASPDAAEVVEDAGEEPSSGSDGDTIAADDDDEDEEEDDGDSEPTGEPSEAEQQLMDDIENEALNKANHKDVQKVAKLELTLRSLQRLTIHYTKCHDDAIREMERNARKEAAVQSVNRTLRRDREEEAQATSIAPRAPAGINPLTKAPPELPQHPLAKAQPEFPQRNPNFAEFRRQLTQVPSTQVEPRPVYIQQARRVVPDGRKFAEWGQERPTQ